MVVGIHQLHYLPWLRYVEKIVHSDVFVVLDNIQFNKNGWQNRNRLKTAAGETLLTVPVRAHAGQTLDQVRIHNGVNWKRKHWRTLEQSYRKAGHFPDIAPFLEDVYTRDWEYLNDLNRYMLDHFLKILGVTTRVVYASELGAPGAATERLVNIIKAVGGDTYYTGAYALDTYLDRGELERSGIKLRVQHWTPPVYPQLHGDFVSDLSIVDLLMNCGDRALQHFNGRSHD